MRFGRYTVCCAQLKQPMRTGPIQAPSSITELIQLKATADQWWSFGSTLFGAVVGSAVAGVISYLLAAKASKEVLKRDEAARREKDAAMAFQLLVKIGKILSSLAALHHQTEQSIKDAEAKGVSGSLWTKVIPIVATDKRVYFEAQEIAVLVKLRVNDEINELLILDDKHNGLLRAMELYSHKRSEFGSRFGANIKSDNAGSTFLTVEEMLKASPLMVELNALAESIRSGAREDYTTARSVFLKVSKVLRANFSDVGFPEFEAADYEAAKKQETK